MRAMCMMKVTDRGEAWRRSQMQPRRTVKASTRVRRRTVRATEGGNMRQCSQTRARQAVKTSVRVRQRTVGATVGRAAKE
jgi:hypothetical protein